jgi:hypothetical protein
MTIYGSLRLRELPGAGLLLGLFIEREVPDAGLPRSKRRAVVRDAALGVEELRLGNPCKRAAHTFSKVSVH